MLDLYYVSNRIDNPEGIKLFNEQNIGYKINNSKPYYNQPYIKLTEPPFYFNYEAITDNTYKYSSIDTKNGERITSLFKDITDETYPLVIKCKTQTEYDEAINQLYRLVNYDITTETQGYFVLSNGQQDWFLKGYILGFEKSLWQHDMGMAVCNLSIVFEDKLWKRIIWLGSETHGTRSGTNNATVTFDISGYKLEKPSDFVMFLKPYTFIEQTETSSAITRTYEGLDDVYGIGFGLCNNIYISEGTYYNNANWIWKKYFEAEVLGGRMGTFGGTYNGKNLKHKRTSTPGEWDFRSIEYKSWTPTCYIPKELRPCERPWCPYVRFDTKNNTIDLIDAPTNYSWQDDLGNNLIREFNFFKGRYNDTGNKSIVADFEPDMSNPRKIIGGDTGLFQITTFIEPRVPDADGIIPSVQTFGDVPVVNKDGGVYSSNASYIKPFVFELFITDERRCPVWN